MVNLCGEKAAADPFLSCGASLCLKEDPCLHNSTHSFAGKGFAGFSFFLNRH